MNIDHNERRIVEQFTAESPVRLVALGEALGLEILKSPLKPEISGLIEPSETARAGFRVRVNRHETPERQRFTLAHEISHYLLHRDRIGGGVFDNVMYRSNLSSKLEVEANRLAADIIMPMPLVNRRLAELGGRVTDEVVIALSQIFRVSQPAMRIRLGV